MPFAILVGLLWFSPFQDTRADHQNARFVEDVVRCLRDVRDTRESRIHAAERLSDREKGFVFALTLQRSADAISRRMEPWKSAHNARVRKVAMDLLRAAGSLRAMGAAMDDLLKGRGDSDRHSARFRIDRETLEKVRK